MILSEELNIHECRLLHIKTALKTFRQQSSAVINSGHPIAKVIKRSENSSCSRSERRTAFLRGKDSASPHLYCLPIYLSFVKITRIFVLHCKSSMNNKHDSQLCIIHSHTTHPCTHAHIRTYTHTHIQAHIHTCMHASIHTGRHTRTHALTHAQTHNMHTLISSCTHMHTQSISRVKLSPKRQ